MPITITIDANEARTAAGVVELLSARWDRVAVAALSVGDFSLSGRVVIERKTLPDLALSLRDGRLFSQAYRLNGRVARPVVIVEGEESALRRTFPRRGPSGDPDGPLRGVLLSLAVGYRIPVVRTRTLAETVETIVHIAKQESKRIGRPAVRWCDPAPPAGDAMESGGAVRQAHGQQALDPRVVAEQARAFRELVDVLCAVPGVGRVRARAIATRIGGLGDVARIGLRELMAVPGVGPSTAVRIHEALHRRGGSSPAVRTVD